MSDLSNERLAAYADCIRRGRLDEANIGHTEELAIVTELMAFRESAALEAEMEADFADDWQDAEVVTSAWERFKASMPAAKVINDNQPDNQAIVQVLCDPPTLPVGTLLYVSRQAVEDNALLLAALMEPSINDDMVVRAMAEIPGVDHDDMVRALEAALSTQAGSRS
jgi:hypothetical protein